MQKCSIIEFDRFLNLSLVYQHQHYISIKFDPDRCACSWASAKCHLNAQKWLVFSEMLVFLKTCSTIPIVVMMISNMFMSNNIVIIFCYLWWNQSILHCTKKFFIKGFCSKSDQLRRKLRIWSHLLKKSLMENFIFCAVLLLPSLKQFTWSCKLEKLLLVHRIV